MLRLSLRWPVKLLAMVSTASIPLPDEVAYRRECRSHRIFLSFGDLPGEVERRGLPAPEPPPRHVVANFATFVRYYLYRNDVADRDPLKEKLTDLRRLERVERRKSLILWARLS
jgi:hypothetical protein